MSIFFTEPECAKLSEQGECKKATKSREPIVRGTLQLDWLRFSSVSKEKNNENVKLQFKHEENPRSHTENHLDPTKLVGFGEKY
jgi:hypothetical protein